MELGHVIREGGLSYQTDTEQLVGELAGDDLLLAEELGRAIATPIADLGEMDADEFRAAYGRSPHDHARLIGTWLARTEVAYLDIPASPSLIALARSVSTSVEGDGAPDVPLTWIMQRGHRSFTAVAEQLTARSTDADVAHALDEVGLDGDRVVATIAVNLQGVVPVSNERDLLTTFTSSYQSIVSSTPPDD